ncbi:MAG: bifunctional precorrin-2 dehydrogenase/sirohydrochlorin ferrochelatase [Candidatus Omnitrophica bacterium]|nr:bifunctional precorrin-2 dehydrogenase/sirohydrochlorin ferrochelatase [Candidatus Omnitrophota bacterium]
MRYYPLFADLFEKICCVVGGGQVAERKVRVLLKCRAKVIVYSPRLTAGLERLSKAGKIVWRRSAPGKDFLRGVFLVVAATNNRFINSRVSLACRKKNILVNVVDVPGESNFIVPSFVENKGLVIAISTSGQAPCLAKKIRKDLAKNFLPHYSGILKELSSVRNRLKASSCVFSQRKAVLNKFINSKILRKAGSCRKKTG